jgi:hypothetical protein
MHFRDKHTDEQRDTEFPLSVYFVCVGGGGGGGTGGGKGTVRGP